MKLSILKINPHKSFFGYVAVGLALLLLGAGPALGDAVDDGLPAGAPQAVKVSARQAIQNGLKQDSVVNITRAMLQSKFDHQQIQLAHALMIEAHNSGMPVEPLMNKAFEGMAKNVPAPMIVRAMETVQARNAFAFQRAAKLAKDKSHTQSLGRTLAAGLAAGLSMEDADKITAMVQQRARSMNSEQAHSLALACFQTARDASRLGVSSAAVTGMLSAALAKGFSHEDMQALHSSFVARAQHDEPQSLAHGYAAAIQAGKGFQDGAGAAGGSGSGSGGSGAGSGGSGEGGSGGGSDGGSGAGSGGGSGSGSGGSGGSGSGGSGSGGSGPGSGGSGGSGPGGGGNQ